MARRASRLILASFPAPRKVSWYYAHLFYQKGDVWEQRVNEWGVWDDDFLFRWVWDGKAWVEDTKSVDIP